MIQNVKIGLKPIVTQLQKAQVLVEAAQVVVAHSIGIDA
jgi:hypothetical protein